MTQAKFETAAVNQGSVITGNVRQTESRARTRWLLKRVAGGSGVGLLLALCFPPFGAFGLLLFAFAALFRLLRGATSREAWYIGLACGVALYTISLFWLRNLFGSAAVSLWVLAGAFPALFAALWVGLKRRLPFLSPLLLAGVVWTGVELFRTEIMRPAFGWMAPGYALAGSPVASWLASVIGGYGLGFCVVLAAAWLAGEMKTKGDADTPTPERALEGTGTTRQNGSIVRIAMAGAWLLICALPSRSPAPERPLAVRLVQANSEDEDSLFALSPSHLAEHPNVIVWPEYSFVRDVRHDRKLWAKLQSVPRKNQAYFLLGAKAQDDPRDDAHFRNTAFLMDKTGNIIGTHVKNHTVPFIKDGDAGTEARAFLTEYGKWGVAICYDMDMPDIARRLAADGAEVLLVPSDNPGEWGDVQRAQHRQVFTMRAAETGRWIATSDVAGNTFAVAPNGRIVAQVKTGETAALSTVVGLEAGATWFVQGGWRFGPLCLAALVGLCLWAMLPARFRRLYGQRQSR